MKLIRCALGIAVFAALSFGADAVLLGLVPAGARMVARLFQRTSVRDGLE